MLSFIVTVAKGTVFFFPDKFVFAHFWAVSIEWMKKLFFFFPGCFFFSGLQNWMNEWHVNFSAENKTQKKHKQNMKKKKNNPLLLKKRGLHQNPNEWPVNFSAERKKHILFFFFRAFGKKKTRFSDLNEWMTNELIPGKKRRYFAPI